MIEKIDVVTTTVGDKIIQDIYRNSVDVRELWFRRVIDLQDQQLRAALIALGWTPPATEDKKN